MAIGKLTLLGGPESSSDTVLGVPFARPVALDGPIVGILVGEPIPHEDWWRKECQLLLARGGRLILFMGPAPQRAMEGTFFQWLMGFSGIQMQAPGGPLAIKCLTPALGKLLDNDLAYYFFGAVAGLTTKVLAVTAGAEGMYLGGIVNVDKGQVVVLPRGITHQGLEHIVQLADSIPPSEDYPTYLDAMPVASEEEARAELASIKLRTTELEAQLEAARRLKRILYLGEFDLEVAVVEFLTAELSLPARHVVGNTEDFWLTEGEIDWAIGEVKSSGTGNIDRVAIAQVLTHRKEAGRPDDFPALLVSNTYYRRSTVKERDEVVHPEVARRAREDNILLARTLDLFRLREVLAGRNGFAEALRNGRGGWFRVDADLRWRITPA